jgi:RimJ/RimL family protein N-acetyltransferase
VTGLDHPELLTDGIVELRRWREDDIVIAIRGGTVNQAQAWVRQQQDRPSAVGVSCAVATRGRDAVGYVGLIRRPRVEMGVVCALTGGDLVFRAHHAIAGIGYWIVPEAQGNGLATRSVRLLSRWALSSADVIRVEALLEPSNSASRRVVEKSGFQPEGRLRLFLELDGRHADALVYSLVQSDL